MEPRENLIELCRKINDGHYEITPECAEYKAFEQWITDEEISVMLAINGTMKPNTVGAIAKRAGVPKARTKEVLHRLTEIGMLIQVVVPLIKVEFYLLPLYTPGIFEFLMLNDEFVKAHPEIAQSFHDHATDSQITHAMNTPMGAGVMRVVPVETAIPTESEKIDKETCSYYLKKHAKHIVAMPCQCRRVRKMMGEGSGDMDEPFCLFLGPVADMWTRMGRGQKLSLEEAMDAIERFEEIGCVHQITTLNDGDTAAICNCQPESCLALGVTQYFNTPLFSQSNYVADIDPEKCVACGECTTVCANNAIQMGQKICSETPIEYPEADLPDDLEWGPERWNPNYRYNRKFVADSGTSPCKSECPAHISVQGYIKLASQGKYMDALELIKRENPFPAVCGRICNRRCESACTRGDIDNPVAIDDVKRFIADKELDKSTRFVPKKLHNYEGRVAVIGGGPAGLSCAYFLAAMGHQVTVFEKNEKPGGMLVYGIPAFRLEKDVVDAEIDVLRELGVEFRCGIDVGKDLTLDDLRKEGFDGFYVAIGAQGGRMAGVEGEDAEGVITGVDFLRQVNHDNSMKLNGNAVVVGGGNVAVDVARAAARVADGQVTMLCLESQEEMPADPLEVEEAESEGVKVMNGWGPAKILQENGKVTGIVFKKCLSVFNEEGKFSPVFDENDTITIECSNVLLSIGQSIQWGNLLDGTKVEFNRNNTAQADSFTYQTAQEDVFVGGDVYTGPKFAIDAIAAGKQGAISLHRYVSEGQCLTAGRDRREFKMIDKDNVDFDAVKESFDNTPRQVPGRKSEALDFHDNRINLTEEQIKAETARCLKCGASHVDQNKCLGCGVCTTRCKFDAIHLTRRTDKPSMEYKTRAVEFPKFKEERQKKIRIRKSSNQ